MVKELMHDPIFLAGKSEAATKEDMQVAEDLLDTLTAHKDSCVGMAANMIGVKKRIIAFLDESGNLVADAFGDIDIKIVQAFSAVARDGVKGFFFGRGDTANKTVV